MYEFEQKSILGVPRVIIPRATDAKVVAVAAYGLPPMHPFWSNSPYVVLQRDREHWEGRTEVRKGGWGLYSLI